MVINDHKLFMIVFIINMKCFGDSDSGLFLVQLYPCDQQLQ